MQDCSFDILLRLKAFFVGEFRCQGNVSTTRQEAAKYPEIVMPQSGAYVRTDAHGSVYLDETVIGFFEAGQPYSIEHLAPRPDVTTVISFRNVSDLNWALSNGAEGKSVFGRSAVRATPELHLLHKQLLSFAKDNDSDQLAGEELATMFATSALEQCRTAPDLVISDRLKESIPGRVIVDVAEYIRKRFRTKLTLEEIAEYAGYSVFHLCRMFNTQMMTTIYQYVRSLRMESAHSALLKTDAPITTIAMDHGFSSHAHFTSQFSKYFGTTPIAVRQGQTGSQI